MRNKGFANVIEMIMVVIVLYIAFSIFFPGFSYKSKWADALLSLNARDVIITSDRIGRLYDYSFNQGALQDFLANSISNENLISWSDTDGAIKNQIIIACNCTNQQMVNLNTWMNGLIINGRQITATQCYTNLETVNPCIISSDVLVIWGQGQKNLSDIESILREYLKGDGGIVEIANFSSNIDSVQKNIFGLKNDTWGISSNSDTVIPPPLGDANAFTYQAYKIYTKGLKGNSTMPEFCYHSTTKRITPFDGDNSKILVSVATDPTAACVILNGTRVAWMSDFTNGNYDFNHTKMLVSIILAASNKRPSSSSTPAMSTGFMTPYINVKNTDMYEVYEFDLGLGYPY